MKTKVTLNNGKTIVVNGLGLVIDFMCKFFTCANTEGMVVQVDLFLECGGAYGLIVGGIDPLELKLYALQHYLVGVYDVRVTTEQLIEDIKKVNL